MRRALFSKWLAPRIEAAEEAHLGGVAQISNLPYRRFPIGKASRRSRRGAGWKPAIQQIGNLRYEDCTARREKVLGPVGALPQTVIAKTVFSHLGLDALATCSRRVAAGPMMQPVIAQLHGIAKAVISQLVGGSQLFLSASSCATLSFRNGSLHALKPRKARTRSGSFTPRRDHQPASDPVFGVSFGPKQP